MAHPSHQWACGSLGGSWQGMVRARSLRPAPRPPCPLPRGPTPHACLTKKRGVKCVCPVDCILLQEAGVGEAALDHPAPRRSGIQHRAPLCTGPRHGHQAGRAPPTPKGPSSPPSGDSALKVRSAQSTEGREHGTGFTALDASSLPHGWPLSSLWLPPVLWLGSQHPPLPVIPETRAISPRPGSPRPGTRGPAHLSDPISCHCN